MKTSENQKFVGAGATGGDVIPMLGGLHSSGQCFSDLSKISDVSNEDKQPVSDQVCIALADIL